MNNWAFPLEGDEHYVDRDERNGFYDEYIGYPLLEVDMPRETNNDEKKPVVKSFIHESNFLS